MVFPAGVTTRNIVFSGVTDAEDNAAAAYTTRAAVVCNSKLFHAGTGVVLVPSIQYKSSGFVLPVTDQLNVWSDGNGNNLITSPTHSYHVELEYQLNGEWIPYRTIPELLVPSGAGDYDLDLVLTSNTRYTDV